MMRTLFAAALVAASVPALANEANDRITENMIKNLKPGERLNVNCLGDTCNYDIRKGSHVVSPRGNDNKGFVRQRLPDNHLSGY